MNKANAIQRSKLFSSYGGVGSSIETIENLSFLVAPFDQWNIYQTINNAPVRYQHLILKEDRLKARLQTIGFNGLNEFFILDDFAGDTVNTWRLEDSQSQRMVNCTYFPRWFYCPKCHLFKPINEWRNSVQRDNRWSDNPPSCTHCNKPMGNNKTRRTHLQQIRFVLASLESGNIIDIPWDQVFAKRGKSDEATASVWYIDTNTPKAQEVKFYMTKGSSDLYGIYVKNDTGQKVTMAEIMDRYFVITDHNGRTTVYRPVIRNANNVYFGYNLSSIYIPQVAIEQTDVDVIQCFVNSLITVLSQFGQVPSSISAQSVKDGSQSRLSIDQIQAVLDTAAPGGQYTIPPINRTYNTEEDFRAEEFDYLTDVKNYDSVTHLNNKCDELESEIYDLSQWSNKPRFINNIYFMRKLTVTTVQVAYSRIDKIGPSHLAQWEGQSDLPKQWYNCNTKAIVKDIPVKLRPTCDANIATISRMPAVQSTGEGFMIELDLSHIDKTDANARQVFLHTFSHLVMKELEFSCGYPLASMNERIYFIPAEDNNSVDRFGILIYSANGEAGSYGGITSLFQSQKINDIIEYAIELANDCPNDPVCENERGHCFACVDIPETACELFNTQLSRKVFLEYK